MKTKQSPKRSTKRKAKTVKRADYDSPWKELIERYFPYFMAFFFPQADAEIDWSRGYEFLDKELQRVTRRSITGRHTVDKLVKVWLKDGSETWLLIHIEIQSQPEDTFAERMFVYNYRLYDRYKQPVISLAILADSNNKWQPKSFGYSRWGCEMRLTFPTVKLLEYKQKWAQLEVSTNPFALAVMAHLKMQETRRKPQDRLRWKIELVQILYDRGYSRDDIYELFRFIDWLMQLPEALELQFEEQVDVLEEQRQMKYIPTFERRAMQRGRISNAQEDVIEILNLRFQSIPPELIEQINASSDLVWLKQMHRQAVISATLEDFERLLEPTKVMA